MVLNIDGDIKLLGIPPMETGTVQSQYETLLEFLEEYGVTETVSALCSDTTATNTGQRTVTNMKFRMEFS